MRLPRFEGYNREGIMSAVHKGGAVGTALGAVGVQSDTVREHGNAVAMAAVHAATYVLTLAQKTNALEALHWLAR
jgi:hypothetical protein